MANYFRVSPKFWIKARERGWTDAQTTLALYLLTCEHRKLEGLYRLPRLYIASDLAWPARKADEALAAVCDSGFAAYDDEASVVFIPKALKHQRPGTENHIRGAIAQLAKLPHTCLWDAFVMACASHCPKLAEAIAVAWPSDASGISHAREDARGEASSSKSLSSISNPPQPPEQARGEHALTGDASPGVPKNSRAHGTNRRALAEASRQATDAVAADVAAGSLVEPSGEQRERWEQLRPLLVTAAGDGIAQAHVEALWLAGADADGTLVLDGPRESWSWAEHRFTVPLQAWADTIGVRARLATAPEHAGLERVAA